MTVNLKPSNSEVIKLPKHIVRAGPEKYWPTSKKIFLAFLFNKNSENIENAAGRFDPGSSSTVRAKLPVELYGFFVHYWPLKHIYIFSGPKHMLDGLLFRPGPDVFHEELQWSTVRRRLE